MLTQRAPFPACAFGPTPQGCLPPQMAAMIQRGVRRCLRPLALPSAPSSRTWINFVFSDKLSDATVTEFDWFMCGKYMMTVTLRGSSGTQVGAVLGKEVLETQVTVDFLS